MTKPDREVKVRCAGMSGGATARAARAIVVIALWRANHRTGTDRVKRLGPFWFSLPASRWARAAAIAFAAVAVVFASCGRRGELLGTVRAVSDGGSGGAPVPGGTGGAPDPVGTGGAPDPGGTGGAPDPGDGGPADAGSSAPRFSAPQLVAPLSNPTAEDGDPTFSGDLLELVFTSNRYGSKDLWVSRRVTASDPWGSPAPIDDLNTGFAEYSPTLSLDGLRIWFTTDRDMTAGRIWRSLRPSRSAPWGPAFPVPELANPPGGPARDFALGMEAAETLLMFSSNRRGALAYDIYFATRTGGGLPWEDPMRVSGINGPLDDWDPFVAQGGLVVFFASTRTGAGDLFFSARQSTAEAFPTPQPLVDLNSPSFESDPTLSQDLTYIMFDSDRSGNSEIYEAHVVF